MDYEKTIREKATAFIAEVWNQQVYTIVPEIMANPVLLHIKKNDIASTHAQLSDIVDRWHERIQGFHFDTEALIVDGDMAVLLLTLHGLPKDAEEPEPLAVRHVFILRFEQGIIVEAWELNDFP